MSAGRVFLASLLALLLAIGASSTASAGTGYRLDLMARSTWAGFSGWPATVSMTYPAALAFNSAMSAPSAESLLPESLAERF